MSLLCADLAVRTRLCRSIQRITGSAVVATEAAQARPGPLLAWMAGLSADTQAAVLRRDDSVALLPAAEASSALFAHATPRHVLAVSEALEVTDLLPTLRKMQQRAAPERFGAARYLRWGSALQRRTLRSSDDRADAIALLEEAAARFGLPARLRALLDTVADELLTNAFYHAPPGPPARGAPVELDEGIELSFGCDGLRFAVSVSDPFGSLNLTHVGAALRRGAAGRYEHGESAGLGLFHVFQSLNHLVINLAPGKRTELIGLINISGGYRRFAEGGHSFTLFSVQ